MKIQSNGMGTQSVAMYLMASTGILPRFDYSIFVDTGLEKPRTYWMLDWLQKWAKKNNGIELIVITKKNLASDLLKKNNSTGNRFASIPAFTNGSDGMLRRQCTSEYKIVQIQRKIKEIQGLGANDRYLPFDNYIGISLDELSRVGMAFIAKETRIYPFCNIETTKAKTFHYPDKYFEGNGVTRGYLINWLLENNYPDPGKSSCAFCPFMSDSEWKEIKKDPETWKEVVAIDEAIRDSSKQGVKNPIYLHKQCKPINEVTFIENQTSMFNCDGGVCHV